MCFPSLWVQSLRSLLVVQHPVSFRLYVSITHVQCLTSFTMRYLFVDFLFEALVSQVLVRVVRNQVSPSIAARLVKTGCKTCNRGLLTSLIYTPHFFLTSLKPWRERARARQDLRSLIFPDDEQPLCRRYTQHMHPFSTQSSIPHLYHSLTVAFPCIMSHTPP